MFKKILNLFISSLITFLKKPNAHVFKLLRIFFQELVEDFIFPASKIVIQCRRSRGELPSDQAIPVCSTPLTVIAAFDLLVALCTGCVQNLRCLSEMLNEMYYTGEASLGIY